MIKSITESLKAIMGGPAGYRRLTAQKAAHILEVEKGEITGFVIKMPDGTTAVVDTCAVRWIGQQEMTRLMHHIPSPLINRIRLMTAGDIKLMAGEMTAGEMRTCKAVLAWVVRQMEEEHNNVVGANALEAATKPPGDFPGK